MTEQSEDKEHNPHNPYHHEHSYYEIWQNGYESGWKNKGIENAQKIITAAYSDGWVAWDTGKLLKDNPYTPDTDLYKLWNKGYEAASEANL